jgi:LCP family protein required for cell wall assembly
MTNQEAPRPHKIKRRLRVGRLLAFIVIAVLIVFGCFMAGVFAYSALFKRSQPPKTAAATEEISKDETLNKRINVLLLGIDDGDSEDMALDTPKRTDAMIVVSFDPENKDVAMLSIPRDTRVSIPGRRWPDKANSAYAYGGVSLAKQTVANLLQIPIHYYMLVNWQGFIEVVDMMGGVDMYVDHNMNYEDPYANLKIHIKQGYQHLNGKQSGEYVRFRHDELGDIGRVQRQQKFLKTLASQFFTFSNLVKTPALIQTMFKYVSTDMDAMTMLRAANSFRIFGDSSLHSEMLFGDFKTIQEISYWQTTPSQVTKTLDKLKIPHKEIKKI